MKIEEFVSLWYMKFVNKWSVINDKLMLKNENLEIGDSLKLSLHLISDLRLILIQMMQRFFKRNESLNLVLLVVYLIPPLFLVKHMSC